MIKRICFAICCFLPVLGFAIEGPQLVDATHRYLDFRSQWVSGKDVSASDITPMLAENFKRTQNGIVCQRSREAFVADLRDSERSVGWSLKTEELIFSAKDKTVVVRSTVDTKDEGSAIITEFIRFNDSGLIAETNEVFALVAQYE